MEFRSERECSVEWVWVLVSFKYLSESLLQSGLFGDREFTHSFPAALQLLHLLLQPMRVGRAAPRQVSHWTLQGPDAPCSLAQLLLEHLQRAREERSVEVSPISLDT